MPSTYTTNNKLTKQANNENLTTWGTIVNEQAFDLIDQSLDGVVNSALSGTSTTITIPDGSLDSGRSRCIRFTGVLSATHTVTIAPNTVQKVYFLANNTTGGYGIVVQQGGGSGSTITIPPSNWAIVFCDGTGSNANVTTITAMTFSGAITAGSFSGSGASLTSIPATGIATTSHARAVTTVAQPIPSDTPTIVQYITEQYDTLNEYNTGTYRFTAAATGYYTVSAAVEMEETSYSPQKFLQLHVYANGSLYASGSPWINTASSSFFGKPGVSVHTTVSLTAGQYVEIFLVNNSTIARNTGTTAGRNYLTIDRTI